ncbi:hypothetical protein CEXT_770451 [Caerostris extrusa]|uniref:Uncharacterized protein n=1 Tax=Caerostris extrusa TaxID=172846 RepID=A0AAV4VHT2_CAEEX|nr:hypothetical protein CEXT_770451 [Caerostris extrusa]
MVAVKDPVCISAHQLWALSEVPAAQTSLAIHYQHSSEVITGELAACIVYLSTTGPPVSALRSISQFGLSGRYHRLQ